MAAAISVQTATYTAAEEDDLARTWRQVEDRVTRMALDRGFVVRKSISIDDVIQCLDQARAQDSKAAEKYKDVKNIFNKTLQCIQTVGGIVASGASNVFAPAGQCYNALTFVIQAWQGYSGIFDTLASLLERCTEFMERLTYYKGNMDAKLTKVACKHLNLFVEICDHTLKLEKKRHRLAAVVKVTFLKDDGIQGLLGQMKDLISEEHGLVAAQTFKLANESVNNTRDTLAFSKITDTKLTSLLDDKSQQRKENDLRKWKLAVTKGLEFDQSALKDQEPDPEKWEKTWRKNKEDAAPGTGEWLADHTVFKSWMTGEGKPILALVGSNGSGKTLLASNATVLLKKQLGVDSTGSRSAIAYFFVESGPKATPSRTALVNNMSRCLLWQLAKADSPFLKSAAIICDNSQVFRNHTEMWTQLLLENEDRRSSDCKFFLVIDGLENNVEDIVYLLQNLSINQARCHTRVLLTGSYDMLNIIEAAKEIEVDTITLGEANKRDIELYINHRINSMEKLADTTKPLIVDTRAKILSKLMDQPDGDYYRVGRDLDDIAKAETVEEIDQILEESGKPRPDKILDDIKTLNDTCSPNEIAEINELILWINDSYMWLHLNEMEAAIALKNQRSSAVVKHSLLSLREKITRKYSKLFSVCEDDEPDYKVFGIKEQIPRKPRGTLDDISTNGTQEILPAEINIVKHYLSTVCPRDVYEKFGFEDFFSQKLVRKSNTIWQDPDNGQITIALRCLDCLAEPRTTKTEALHDYAMDKLGDHLRDTDLSVSDRALKSACGALLPKLFTDEQALDSLFQTPSSSADADDIEFDDSFIPENLNCWILSNQGVTTMTKWFSDSAVLEQIANNDLVTAFKSAEGDKHLVLFQHAAKRLATQLFRQPSTPNQMLYSFVFLAGLLTKTNRARPENDDDDDDTNGLEDIFEPSVDLVQKVEDYAKKALAITETDSLWEIQMALLLTYVGKQEATRKASEARARRAYELDKESWKAAQALSRVVDSPTEGITLLTHTIETLRQNEEWLSELENKTTLIRLMMDLGDRYWDNDDTELAVETYLKSIDVRQSFPVIKRHYLLVSRFTDQGNWPAIVALIERVLQQSDTQESFAGDFALEATKQTDLFHYNLAYALEKQGRSELAVKLYEKAIACKPEYWPLYVMRYFCGMALDTQKDNEAAALKVWEPMLDEEPGPDEEHQRPSVLQSLSGVMLPAYLALARRSSPDVAKECYDKIEDLYTRLHEHTDDQGSSNLPTIVGFARYFFFRGDTVRAKQILKSAVIDDLEMLSDDDITNDRSSFTDLHAAFCTLNDTTNAAAAMEMMARAARAAHAAYIKKEGLDLKEAPQTASDGAQEGPEDSDVKENTHNETANEKNPPPATEPGPEPAHDSEPEPEPEPESVPVLYTMDILWCDFCGKVWRSASEIWSCMDACGAVQLCDDCYKKLQNDDVQPAQRRTCNKSHKLYYIGKRDDKKMDAVPDGHVPVGDETITLEEWKSRIRAVFVDFEDPAVGGQGGTKKD